MKATRVKAKPCKFIMWFVGSKVMECEKLLFIRLDLKGITFNPAIFSRVSLWLQSNIYENGGFFRLPPAASREPKFAKRNNVMESLVNDRTFLYDFFVSFQASSDEISEPSQQHEFSGFLCCHSNFLWFHRPNYINQVFIMKANHAVLCSRCDIKVHTMSSCRKWSEYRPRARRDFMSPIW